MCSKASADRALGGQNTHRGLLLGGIADDTFMDFRTWLVCHGGETYERALADPDAIVDLPYDEVEEDFGFAEQFAYVADEVYELRTGAKATDEDIYGSDLEFDQATLRARFPRLWQRAERLHPEYLEEREEMYRQLHPDRPSAPPSDATFKRPLLPLCALAFSCRGRRQRATAIASTSTSCPL